MMQVINSYSINLQVRGKNTKFSIEYLFAKLNLTWAPVGSGRLLISSGNLHSTTTVLHQVYLSTVESHAAYTYS